MSAATTPAASAAMSLIAGMAGKSTAAAKSKKPEVNDPSLDLVIKEYITRKAEAETAKALADSSAEQIIATVRPLRLQACVEAGKVLPSVSVNGALTYTQQCRYSAVPEERAEALAAAFGDAMDRYFKPTLKIELKTASANDEAVLTKLVEALGVDFFQAHFGVKRDLLVQDAFHNDHSTRPEVQAAAQPFIDEQTIRPYSPSLKIQ